jgi:DNA-binding GntR family transcriptional regulator
MTVSEHAWTLAPQRSLSEVVADRVVEAMRSGVLGPGERIVEATLARQLGVSRGPLREALKALEADHLVERRHNRGTFAAQITPEQALQMVTMRAALEGLAARLVAARGSPEVLGRLEAQHARICATARKGRASAWRDEDWRFHEMVCRAAANEFLLRSWLSIGNLVRLFLHQKLIAVLRAGDPDAADATFRTVILRSGFRRLNIPTPPEFAAFLATDAIGTAPPARIGG